MTEPRTPEPNGSPDPLGSTSSASTGLTGIPSVDPDASPPAAVPTMPPWSASTVSPTPVLPGGPDATEIARESFENLATTTRTWLAGLDPTGWRPTLIVAGILAALVLGTQLINAAIPVPGSRPLPGQSTGPSVPGAPVVVAGDVRFVLVSGWQITQRYADQLPGVGVQKGDVRMEIRATVAPSSGSANDLLQQFRAILARQLAAFQSTPPSPVSTNGMNGLGVQYQGTNRNGNVQEGVMYVFISPSGTGILAHAGGQRGSIEPLLEEIQAMVGSLEAS
jgi:hypothetical protein